MSEVGWGEERYGKRRNAMTDAMNSATFLLSSRVSATLPILLRAGVVSFAFIFFCYD